MSIGKSTARLALLLAGALIAAPGVQAQKPGEDPGPIDEVPTSRDELMRKLTDALDAIPLIGEDNSALVEKMANPRLGPPLSETFSSAAAIKNLLGRGAVQSPDCRKPNTAAGDPDPGTCRVFKGTEAGPLGQDFYIELRYSKNLQFGDVSYQFRPASPTQDVSFDSLVPTKMTDAEAYEKGMKWLAENFGMTTDEIPPPPQGFYPVKTVALAGQEGGKAVGQPVPVEKLLLLRRGLFVGLGDDKLGHNFDWVPAPGKAFVAIMADGSVREAAIRDWRELQPLPEDQALRAKKRSELMQEMADDLTGVARGPIDHILIGLIITALPRDNGMALLLPAIQAAVVMVPNDLSEEEQNALALKQVSTAGVIRTYPLVFLDNEVKATE